MVEKIGETTKSTKGKRVGMRSREAQGHSEYLLDRSLPAPVDSLVAIVPPRASEFVLLPPRPGGTRGKTVLAWPELLLAPGRSSSQRSARCGSESSLFLGGGFRQGG